MFFRRSALIFCIFLAHGAFAAETNSDGHLSIVRVTPSGDEVPTTRGEIIIEFDRPMVPFGESHRNLRQVPVEIKPEIECNWMWDSASQLSCFPRDPFKHTTTYSITIGKSLTAMDGAMLYRNTEFTFRTTSLDVRGRNEYWNSPTEPIFRLTFSQPVPLSTVLEKAHFKSVGSSEEIAVRATLVSDFQARAEEYFRRDTDGTWKRASWEDSKYIKSLLQERDPQRLANSIEANDFAAKGWMIEPSTPLQLDSTYELEIAAGVKSIVATEPTEHSIHIDRFETFPVFEFVGLECIYTDGRFRKHERTNGEAGPIQLDDCNPDEGITLLFTAPYNKNKVIDRSPMRPDPLSKEYRTIRNFSARDQVSPVEISHRFSSEYSHSIGFAPDDSYYKLKIKYSLAGNTNYQLQVGQEEIEDLFGRKLPDSPPIEFRTGNLKPRLQLRERELIFSTGSVARVPAKLANLSGLRIGLHTDVPTSSERTSWFEHVPIATPPDRIFEVPLNVRDFLPSTSGEFVAVVDSIAIPGKGESPTTRCLYGQVTPYNVHTRFGVESSVAWVTNLQTGETVPDATVSLIQRSGSDHSLIAEAKTDEHGIVNLPGKRLFLEDRSYLTRWAPAGTPVELSRCLRPYYAEYAVRVHGPDGYATLPIADNFQHQRMFNDRQRPPHLSVWGHTAQSIYRPGDTLQYKILVRQQTDSGLAAFTDHRFHLLVLDSMRNLVHHRNDIRLSDFGSFHGRFRIPESADRTLTFRVTVDRGESLSDIFRLDDRWIADYSRKYWDAFSVAIIEFNPLSIRVESSLDSEDYSIGDELAVRGIANRLGGGPFGQAPTQFSMVLNSKRFSTQHPKTKDYVFAGSPIVRRTWAMDDFVVSNTRTNRYGEFSASTKLNASGIFFGTLEVSAGVREDTGNIVWDVTRADYRSTNRFLGIRSDHELARVGQPVSVSTVVVNPEGTPTNDIPVSVEIRRKSWSDGEWAAVESCEIAFREWHRTCTMTPEQPGLYVVTAAIKSREGWVQRVWQDIRVQEPLGTIFFDEAESLRLSNRSELEDRQFTIGETATLWIEHEHPASQALITVERLGVLDRWVVELKESPESIEIPIRQDYPSKIRASVTVLDVNSTTKLPHFIASKDDSRFPQTLILDVDLSITDPRRELSIEIDTDKETYRPGENVQARVSIYDRSEADSPVSSEFAVAVVDQGVLDVSRTGHIHFDPMVGLLRNVDFDNDTYDLLSPRSPFSGAQLAVSAHSPPKPPRKADEFLSYWIPDLQTSEDGTASFEFKVGDRLTEWKIIVVAATRTDQFGHHMKSIRTNLEVEIHPVLPNQVTDSDVFDAGFAVLNRTDSERSVLVKIEAEGDCETTTHEETIVLGPFERKVVSSPVRARLAEAHRHTDIGSIELLATASADDYSDALSRSIPVHASSKMFVSSIYGTSTEAQVSEPVEIPRQIKADSGSLSVEVVPSLVNVVGERAAQVRDYPYGCWEQKLSTAVVAVQYARFKRRMNVDWPEWDTYVQDVLQSAADYQSPSGGFAYWSGEYRFEDPYLSAYTALAFRWLMDAGYKVREDVLVQLINYLERGFGYQSTDHLHIVETTNPSLHLLFSDALMQHGRGDPNTIARLYAANKNLSLFAIAQALKALVKNDAPQELLEDLTTRLLDSVGRSGDKAMIHHAVARGGNFLLSSKLKTTCSAISAFIQARDAGLDLVSDRRIAELVRGAMFEWNHRKIGSNPHEAAYCLTAIIEYAESMETLADDLKVDVELALSHQQQKVRLDRVSDTQSGESSDLFTMMLKPEHFGRTGELVLNQHGLARFYYKARLKYEPIKPNWDREYHGIDIRKTYWVKSQDDWVELDESAELRRGDVVHIGLYVDIRDERDFVIVDDPVPGALEPINLRLARTNVEEVASVGPLALREIRLDSGDGSIMGSFRWSFYKRQLRHDSVRFASDFLRTGRYRLYWTGRVISTGDFFARPAHAETMYAREVYGKSKAQRIRVTSD